MKILIPNGTSPKNLGDRVMFESVLRQIKCRYPQAVVTVHSVDPSAYGKQKEAYIRPSLLQWLVFDDPRLVSRIFRIKLLLAVLLFPALPVPKSLHSILEDYRNADLIVFVGNGYLRSKAGLSQAVYLCLQLLPFLFALRFGKKVYIAPLGFGPFAYAWQAGLCGRILNQFPIVRFREPISLALAQSHGVHGAVLDYDSAFHTPGVIAKSRVLHTPGVIAAITPGVLPIIGVSLRSWFTGDRGKHLESDIFKAIVTFAGKIACVIQPIVQVNAPEHHDDDAKIADRLYEFCSRKHIPVKKPVILTSVSHAARVFGSLDLLVGMRMHANIIALSQGTPVVALAYEHKTTGIMDMIGLSRYSIRLEDISESTLTDLLDDAFQNRKTIREHIRKSLKKIQNGKPKI